MVTLDHFELAPGHVVNGRILRGHSHAILHLPELVREDFIARYVGSSLGHHKGEFLLEEVRDASGRPTPLRAVPAEKLRQFFAQFVGFVLRDGGLIDSFSIRDNLLLPFRYQQTWPRASSVGSAELAARLHELLGPTPPPVAAPELLDRHPGEITPFARRYWGLVQTLLRRPQLLIMFAPFAETSAAEQNQLAQLLERYTASEPQSARLFLLSGPHETAALARLPWTELPITSVPLPA